MELGKKMSNRSILKVKELFDHILSIKEVIICDDLHDLVPFVQKVKNVHGEVLLLVKLQALACKKITPLSERFSRPINCTYGTKSRDASNIQF